MHLYLRFLYGIHFSPFLSWLGLAGDYEQRTRTETDSQPRALNPPARISLHILVQTNLRCHLSMRRLRTRQGQAFTASLKDFPWILTARNEGEHSPGPRHHSHSENTPSLHYQDTRTRSNKDTHLTGRLEEIGIAERRAQTEDVVALGMLGYRLHNCTVHDNQVLGRRLHAPALAGVAGIEEQRGALKAHPVALPAPLPGQLDLVLLA